LKAKRFDGDREWSLKKENNPCSIKKKFQYMTGTFIDNLFYCENLII